MAPKLRANHQMPSNPEQKPVYKSRLPVALRKRGSEPASRPAISEPPSTPTESVTPSIRRRVPRKLEERAWKSPAGYSDPPVELNTPPRFEINRSDDVFAHTASAVESTSTISFLPHHEPRESNNGCKYSVEIRLEVSGRTKSTYSRRIESDWYGPTAHGLDRMLSNLTFSTKEHWQKMMDN